jgi:hypothetical protein
VQVLRWKVLMNEENAHVGASTPTRLLRAESPGGKDSIY